MRIVLTVAVLVAACGGERPPTRAEPPAAVAVSDAAPSPLLDAAPPAGPPIDEAHARVLLSERFRAIGLRIRHDVRLTGDGFDLTVDGYDPARRIGFEYIAPGEVGTDLSAGETDAVDGDVRLLVVGPADADQLARSAEQFLAPLRPDAGQP